jgi:hypothetical protein
MHPKNLLIFICLFAGIWFGVAPAKGQTEAPTLSDSPSSEMTQEREQELEQERDWSELAIDAQDLPPGFQGMPAEDLAKLKQELSENDLSVESVFAFMEPNNFELLLGLTTPLKNQQSQKDFEQILAEPEVLRELVTDGMGETQIVEQIEIEELDNIGESVAGVTLKLNLEGVPAQLDIVAFRRQSIGAFMFLLYLDGQTPRMPIVNLARILDDRALELLTQAN